MQFRRYKSGPDGAHNLGQFLPLSHYGNRLDYRDASLRERMPSVKALFVFDNLRRQILLAHQRDHIVGELRPWPDLVDSASHLRSKLGLLLVMRCLLAPPPLVQLTPTVNEFKHASQAFMHEGIVHASDHTAGLPGHLDLH